MINFIIFLIFVILTVLTTSSALGIYIGNQRSHNLLMSGVVCFFFPLFGQIFLMLYISRQEKDNLYQSQKNKVSE